MLFSDCFLIGFDAFLELSDVFSSNQSRALSSVCCKFTDPVFLHIRMEAHTIGEEGVPVVEIKVAFCRLEFETVHYLVTSFAVKFFSK